MMTRNYLNGSHGRYFFPLSSLSPPSVLLLPSLPPSSPSLLPLPTLFSRSLPESAAEYTPTTRRTSTVAAPSSSSSDSDGNGNSNSHSHSRSRSRSRSRQHTDGMEFYFMRRAIRLGHIPQLLFGDKPTKPTSFHGWAVGTCFIFQLLIYFG